MSGVCCVVNGISGADRLKRHVGSSGLAKHRWLPCIYIPSHYVVACVLDKAAVLMFNSAHGRAGTQRWSFGCEGSRINVEYKYACIYDGVDKYQAHSHNQHTPDNPINSTLCIWITCFALCLRRSLVSCLHNCSRRFPSPLAAVQARRSLSQAQT